MPDAECRPPSPKHVDDHEHGSDGNHGRGPRDPHADDATAVAGLGHGNLGPAHVGQSQASSTNPSGTRTITAMRATNAPSPLRLCFSWPIEPLENWCHGTA